MTPLAPFRGAGRSIFGRHDETHGGAKLYLPTRKLLPKFTVRSAGCSSSLECAYGNVRIARPAQLRPRHWRRSNAWKIEHDPRSACSRCSVADSGVSTGLPVHTAAGAKQKWHAAPTGGDVAARGCEPESSSAAITTPGYRSLLPSETASLSVGRLLVGGVRLDCVEASISDQLRDGWQGRPDPGPVRIDVCRDAPRAVRRPDERGRAAVRELGPTPDPCVRGRAPPGPSVKSPHGLTTARRPRPSKTAAMSPQQVRRARTCFHFAVAESGSGRPCYLPGAMPSSR